MALANDGFIYQTWMDNNPPPGSLAECRACGQNMSLLLQLNADLPDRFPNHTRWLYIFGCLRAACNRKDGSIRAYRAVKRTKDVTPLKTNKEEKTNSPTDDRKPGLGLGAQLFASSPTPAEASEASPANTFATSTSNSSLTNNSQSASPFATNLSTTFAEKARISSPPPSASTATPATTTSKKPDGPTAPWPEASEFPEPYPRYYLDADYEALSGPEELDINSKIDIDQMETEDNTPSSSKKNNAANSKEHFESTLDEAFFRFSTRLDQNPEQVLRYEFAGRPLLYSNDDPVGKLLQPQTSTKPAASKIPYCPQCKSERAFELQLVPHAISALEEDSDIPLDDTKGNVLGMEWGTIIVCVCAMDCAPVSVGQVDYREEWVGVQWEEQVLRR